MNGLSVTPESGEAVLFGKTVSELQTDVTIANGGITGTLSHISGYTDFSETEAEQSGNYLAIKVTGLSSGVEVTVEATGSGNGPAVLDGNGNAVIRIANTESQSVKITATYGGKSVTQTYSLAGLTLLTE